MTLKDTIRGLNEQIGLSKLYAYKVPTSNATRLVHIEGWDADCYSQLIVQGSEELVKAVAQHATDMYANLTESETALTYAACAQESFTVEESEWEGLDSQGVRAATFAALLMFKANS